MWVTSTFCGESAVKISAQTDQRAESYACFTEGRSKMGLWEGEETESGGSFLCQLIVVAVGG